MGDDRPPRYVEADGTIVYRASSLGMCDKMFVALANYYESKEHPEWFQEILDEGTNSEDSIIEHYEAATGLSVIAQQRELNWEVMDGVVIRCHIDGETDNGLDSNILFEAKKVRKTQWEKFQRQGVEYGKTYPMQVAAMMFAGDYDSCEFTGGRYVPEETDEETGVVIPAHIDQVYIHHLAGPPVPKLAILKRISHLEKLIDSGAQPSDVPCNVKMYPCPVYYLHDPDEEQVKELTGDDTWKVLFEEYQAVSGRITALESEARKLRERKKQLTEGVSGWLEDKEIESEEKVKVDGVELQWKLAHKDAYEVRASDYKQVVVSKKKGKK